VERHEPERTAELAFLDHAVEREQLGERRLTHHLMLAPTDPEFRVPASAVPGSGLIRDTVIGDTVIRDTTRCARSGRRA